jgi:hypothetical protein
MIKGFIIREKLLVPRICRSSPRNAKAILRYTTNFYKKVRRITPRHAEKENYYNPENEIKRIPRSHY